MYARLRIINSVAVVVHLAFFFVTMAIANFETTNAPLQFSRNQCYQLDEKRFFLKPVYSEQKHLSLPILLYLQFLSTALFHFFYAVDPNYEQRIKEKNQWVRWVEYSISAPIVVCLISVSYGERDAHILAVVCTLTALSMLCAQFSEYSNKKNAVKDWSHFLVGVCLHLATWTLLLSRFWDTVVNTECTGMPDFVYAIVVSQTVLFLLFAVVHYINILQRPITFFFFSGCRWDQCDLFYEGVEMSYILLSFVSKASLGTILLYYVLRSPGVDQSALSSIDQEGLGNFSSFQV